MGERYGGSVLSFSNLRIVVAGLRAIGLMESGE